MHKRTAAFKSYLEGVAESQSDGLFELGLAKDDNVPPEQAGASGESWGLAKGQQIGRYVLVRQMGEGGFGLVWLAEQTEPFRREVALKLIKPGMDSRQVIARFEAERQALALMEHPNIAAVLDADTTEEGRPFFVMELVRGLPITSFCDDHRLTVRQRLELFVKVCNGVQHAHQKAILHRDLKPSNILVENLDGKPAPKIIDFGIAKALGAGAFASNMRPANFTGADTVVGTPEYMSPEQANNDLDIDACSDIYSLGAILYELLVGTPPLQSGSETRLPVDKLLQAIRENEPAQPSHAIWHPEKKDLTRHIASKRNTEPNRLAQELRGDLDWIILKALDKDRRRRYETAAAFAADIVRYLRNEPVTARPPTRIYLLKKLIRRNRVAFLAAGLAFAALLAGTTLAAWGWHKQIQATEQQKHAAERAQAAELIAERESEKSRAVANFLANIFQDISAHEDQTNFTGDDMSAKALHDLLDAADQRRMRELQDPGTDLGVDRILGRAYAELDDLDKAGSLYRKALERMKEMHLNDGSDAADVMFWTAWTHHREIEERSYSTIDVDDMDLVVHCLAIRSKTLPPDDERVVQTQALLVGILRSNSKSVEAAALLDSLLNGPQSQKIQTSAGYGWLLREQALLLDEQGQSREAFSKLDLAEKILSKYAPSQNRLFQVAADMARIRRTFYLREGDLASALEAANAELDHRSKWLGYDDPRTLIAIARIDLQLQMPREAEAKLREAIAFCQKHLWYQPEEEALRVLVDHAASFHRLDSPERLQDITALARIILADPDHAIQSGEGSKATRLDEAADLLRVAETLHEPYPFEAAEFFATRASLSARRHDYPAALRELAKAALANPNNCLYRFESAVYAVAAGEETEYQRLRDALLQTPAADRLSSTNYLWIPRGVLLRPGTSREALDEVRKGLGERLRAAGNGPKPRDAVDLSALREGVSLDSGDTDEFSDWIGLLMGMAEFRAGNYEDASNWLNFAQRSQNPVIAQQKQTVSTMNDFRLHKLEATAALAAAQTSFEKRLARYRDTDSSIALHDYLTSKFLLDEAKMLISPKSAALPK